jgi:uncharacterized membrane protein HdeD (DUF308 family)
MSTPGGGGTGGPGTGVFPGSRLPRWGRTWPAILLAALVTFVLGLILLTWPHATVVVVAALIGVALLVTGLLRLIGGITAGEESGARRTAYVIIGILGVLAGLYALRHIGVTVALLAVIVGLFWAVHGIADIMVAATAPAGSGRGVTALAGILSLAAGLIVMFWPTISLTVLGVILGIWLLCYGVLLAFLAFQLRAVLRAAAR